MSGTLRERSLLGFIWILIDKLGGSTVNFVVTMILARLLFPEDFGLIAMVMIYFELSRSFVESGFSHVLIREKTISEIDKSTTFIFNLVTATVLYLIVFFFAPAIATFFNQPILVSIIRVLGLNIIISSLTIVQQITLTHQIDFKTQTKVRIPAVILSGAVTIILAKNGFGVWSLVVQLLLKEVLSVIFLWIFNPWKPSFRFSWRSFSRLFGFGSKILIAGLIQKFYQEIFNLIIGKYFSVALLGFFTQANNLVNMAINHIFQSIQRIIYPVLSKLKEDRSRLKEAYRKFIKLTSFVIFPMMGFMIVLAEPIVVTLFGDKWLPSAPFVQLLCLSSLVLHFHVINYNVLLVLNYPNTALALSIIEKIPITIGLFIGIKYGVFGVVWSKVAASYINLLFTTYFSKRLLNYSFAAQLKDVAATMIFTLVMTGIVFVINYNFLAPALVKTIGGITIGFVGYFSLHLLVKTEEMHLLRSLVTSSAGKLTEKWNNRGNH